MTEKQERIQQLKAQIKEYYDTINSKKQELQKLENTIEEWEDLPTLSGINARGESFEFFRNEESKVAWESIQTNYQDLYKTAEDAKAALAMAKISQLLPYYGQAISSIEWEDTNLIKYCLVRNNNAVLIRECTDEYHYLAFRSKEFCNKFMESNATLILDYFKMYSTDDD